jgi:tRNA modification GTPase
MIYFEAPSSFTGEDVLEIHAHGSPIVVASILSILDAFPGCRRADPGEFTKRAILNGKMTVLQAESIADVYSARTPLQLHLAHAGSENEHTTLRWRQDLIMCLAQCESVIDFAEDVEYAFHAHVSYEVHLTTFNRYESTISSAVLRCSNVLAEMYGFHVSH